LRNLSTISAIEPKGYVRNLVHRPLRIKKRNPDFLPATRLKLQLGSDNYPIAAGKLKIQWG
jgi:hypothetical protein